MVRALISRGAVGILLVLPWISPLASGPSPSVDSLLISWACAAAVAACLIRPGPGWITGASVVALTAAVLAALSKSPTLGLIALAALLVAGTWSAGDFRPGELASVCAAPAESLRTLVVASLAAAAMVNVVYALLQKFGQAHWFYPLINSAHPAEVYGNLRQRNQMATLTAIGVVSFLYLRGVGARNWLVLPAMALLAAANAATVSRTGAVLLGLIGAGLWIRQRGWTRLVDTVAIAVGYGLMVWFMRGGETAISRAVESQISCGSRLILWSNVLELIQLRPVTGWGWGHLDEAYFLRLYTGPRSCEMPDNAHNLPLHLAAELGLPLAIGFVGLCLWGVYRARPWKETDPGKLWAWAVLSMVGVHSLLEYPLWYGPFQVVSVTGLMLLAGRPLIAWTRSRQWLRPVAAAALALCSALLVAAAWDYHRVSQLYLEREWRSPLYRDGTFQKVSSSVFFSDQLDFAILTTRTITRDNAPSTAELARALLAYSPEPRVVGRLVQSLRLLERNSEADFYAVRFQAAYPQEYAHWLKQGQSAE